MRTIAVTAAVLMIAAACFGQGLRDSSTVVSVTAADTVNASVGETVTFTVTMTIDEGWHLYANSDPQYYGISMNPPEGLPLANLQVVYPEGHMGKFLGEDVRLLAHQESLTVSGILMVQPEEPFAFELELQACDDKSCLAPAWISVPLTVLPKE
jgi:thiol:disulfide interchange protein